MKQQRQFSLTSLGKITERSAQKEIEVSSISFTPQKEKQATPARLGSKLKAPTTFSPKSTREEHDKFLQFVQDSGRNRKSSPTVIERMAKEPEPSTQNARSASNQNRAQQGTKTTYKQKESVNRLTQKTPIRSRRLAGNSQIAKTQGSPTAAKNSKLGFGSSTARPLIPTQQSKVVTAQISLAPQTGQAEVKSLSIDLHGAKKKQGLGLDKSEKQKSPASPIGSDDAIQKTPLIKSPPTPLKYPELDAREPEQIYYESPDVQRGPRPLTSIQDYIKQYSSKYNSVPESPNKSSKSYRTSSPQDLIGTSKGLTLSDFKQNAVEYGFNGDNQYNKRANRIGKNCLNSSKERTPTFPIQLSTNGNVSTDSRAELLAKENFKLKKELFNLKKQIYMVNNEEKQCAAMPQSPINQNLQQIVQESEYQEQSSATKTSVPMKKSASKSPKNWSESRLQHKPVLRENLSNPFIQLIKTPSPLREHEDKRKEQTSQAKSICTHTQHTGYGQRANTMLSGECKECCCQQFVTKASNNRHSGMHSMLSDDSVPSFAILDTDRSKAPQNQLNKLTVQKDMPLSNDPQKAVELRNTLNNYSYDTRLKNLQQSLLNAGKHDNDIRQELCKVNGLHTSSREEFEGDPDLDELVPQAIGLCQYSSSNLKSQKADKSKHVPVRHVPKIGPFSSKFQTFSQSNINATGTSGAIRAAKSYHGVQAVNNKSDDNGEYSVNDVSAAESDDQGSVRFSTQQRRNRKNRSDSKYSKHKTSKSSIQEFANADLFQYQQQLELRDAFSDQEKVTTPKSPAFAADALGEILSSGREDVPKGQSSQQPLSSGNLYTYRNDDDLNQAADSPDEPTPDMPDEIDYEFDPKSNDLMKEIEEKLNNFGVEETPSKHSGKRNKGTFHSRHSSRNHILNEFYQDISIEENTCKQTVRVDATHNNLSKQKDKHRISRTMRQQLRNQDRRRSEKVEQQVQSNLAYKASGSKPEKNHKHNASNKLSLNPAAQVTETMQSVPAEWVPFRQIDVEHSRDKFSQVSVYDEKALSAKVMKAYDDGERVTSADRVKVSSPMNTKTKTYLDTASMRSYNTSIAQSSRRDRAVNQSKASIRTFESVQEVLSVKGSMKQLSDFSCNSQASKAHKAPETCKAKKNRGEVNLGWKYAT